MARNASRLKLGYYPLVPAEAERIRGHLYFPDVPVTALDPCAGTGDALLRITSGAPVRRYGIELDSFRAAEAAGVLDEVVQGSVFDTHSAVESFSLLFLNPPYDDEVADGRGQRTEALFLEQTFRWLQPGGVLALVIPGNRLVHCSDVLAAHFGSLGVYRLTASESSKYSQVVVFGIRRSGQERERARDRDVLSVRLHMCEAARKYGAIEPLQDQAGRVWHVPPVRKTVTLTYRGLPLDSIEDALPTSRAYRQAERLLFVPETQVRGRPLTQPHPGHASQAARIRCAAPAARPCRQRHQYRRATTRRGRARLQAGGRIWREGSPIESLLPPSAICAFASGPAAQGSP
jgi:hypothetical protein